MLSEVDFPLHTRIRNDSLLQRTLAHMVGQFSTSNGAMLDENSVHAVRVPLGRIQVLAIENSSAPSSQIRTAKQGVCSSQQCCEMTGGLGGLERHLIDHWKKMQHKLSESAL